MTASPNEHGQPPTISDAVGAGRTIARLSRVVERCCTDNGLSLAQYRLLVFVNDAPLRTGALADRDAASGPSLTARIDALEAKGLVARSRSLDDRRGIELTLTTEGVVVLERIEACVHARFDAIFPGARGRELLAGLATANAAIEQVTRAARAVPPPTAG